MSDIAITNNQLDQRLNDSQLTERITVEYNDDEKELMDLEIEKLKVELKIKEKK